MGGMGASFGDDDDDMSGNGGGGARFANIFGTPGGFGGVGSRKRPSHPRAATPGTQNGGGGPSEVNRALRVSLEDLYTGTTKKLKVGRKLLSGGVEEKILEVEVQVQVTIFSRFSVRVILTYIYIARVEGWYKDKVSQRRE